MYYVLVASLFLLSAGISYAQTLISPSRSSSTEMQIQQCANCPSDLAASDQPSRVEPSMRTGDLPSAPSGLPSLKPDPVVWNLAELKQPEAALRPDPIWDKKAWGAQIFLAGAMVVDVEATHQGIAHHKCVEGNSGLNRYPSRSELYLDNFEQFAPIVLIDGLSALAFRHAHLPRWAWKATLYGGPIYGSAVHLKGGTEWLTQCW
jgi:hypothetical protein